MAFVLGKSQKKSVFQPSEQHLSAPGPGAYQCKLNNQKNIEYCAPFNTSEVKVSTFQVQQTKYGPGSYEPKYYKDINKSNSAVGYVFASKVQRFQNQNKKINKQQRTANNLVNDNIAINRSKSQCNQTTFYQSNPSDKNDRSFNKDNYNKRLQKSKSVMQQIRSKNQQNKVQSIKGKRQFIRVLLTSSTNTENIESRYIYRNMKGKTLGPGSYQNIQFNPKSKGGAKWKLQKNDRFKTAENEVPGPGTYQNTQLIPSMSQQSFYNQSFYRQRNKKLSASFASTVIRSHMDTIIYKTNIPIKAAILEDKRLKDRQPGPGSYNTIEPNKDKKSFNYGCQTSFGLCGRTSIEPSNYDQPGPGEYQFQLGTINGKIRDKQLKSTLIKEIRTQIFGKKSKIANNSNKNNSLAKSYNYNLKPDPNFINPKSQRQRKQKRITKFCSLEQRCFSKIGNMSQQERFKAEEFKSTNDPGPGQYYQQNNFVQSTSQNKKLATSIFKSTTNRNVFKSAQKQQIPYYNIVRNDIGFKAEKMRRYIQNLKKINIEKTPFQTSSKRFIQKKNQDQLNMIILQNQFHHHRRTISQNKPKQPSCAFKSGTKRQIFESEQLPGPGDYELKMKNNGGYQSLQKKSFNKYYGLCRDIQQQAIKNNQNKKMKIEQDVLHKKDEIIKTQKK